MVSIIIDDNKMIKKGVLIMKKFINTKNIIIAAVLGLFIVAVIINISTNKKENQDIDKDSKAVSVLSNTDYYTAFRDNRDSTRDKEIQYLETILKQNSTDEETVQEANEQKLEIVKCMESEMIVESAIKAKGFTDVAVTFHKGSVNVVVNAEELTDAQVAQILDIVMRQTKEPAENIKISVRR